MTKTWLRIHIQPNRYGQLLGFALCLFLTACANTDKLTFLNYGVTPPTTPKSREELKVAPSVSDGLAINYANSIQMIMRSNSTGSRITREASSTAQVGLAAFGGIGAAFHYSATTLAALGMSSAGIPELQKIFNAKGRAEVYNQAADMIQDGVWEYYSHNPSPSSTDFTPNGLTLVKRVSTAISLVDTTLVGQLPSRKQMLQAVEEMTPEGTSKQNPKADPVNSVGPSTTRVVQKLTPVVIQKEVVHSEGLQSDEVHAVTKAAGSLLKKATPAQAATVAGKVGVNVLPDQDPREALSQTLGESSITAGKAAQILKELQNQIPTQQQ
jgi:hypothetical protein